MERSLDSASLMLALAGEGSIKRKEGAVQRSSVCRVHRERGDVMPSESRPNPIPEPTEADMAWNLEKEYPAADRAPYSVLLAPFIRRAYHAEAEATRLRARLDWCETAKKSWQAEAELSAEEATRLREQLDATLDWWAEARVLKPSDPNLIDLDALQAILDPTPEEPS